jgi:sigma-B regulation protein RsbU (phosphoserine phosphatase)
LTSPTSTDAKTIVLLIDDQMIIAEAVRRMLAPETDIVFQYCSDPTQALAKAQQVHPTVILQDLVMPQMDGMALAREFRNNPATVQIPLIVLSTKEEPKVKAEAFAMGAHDYLVKLPDRIELIARIRHHSQGYIALQERNTAHAALQASQAALAKELQEASDYVRSILPAPLRGAITSNWQFISSSSLGGDAFGYHWIDDDHFAMYLLDVCGHGVGAALLSISVMNVLRTQSLAATDFRQPDRVLAALNEAFPMERQNNMYFTMWYGVFEKSTRRMQYSSGGHPPSVLLSTATGSKVATSLRTPSPGIGTLPDVQFRSLNVEIPPGSKLYIFSDGTYEIDKKDGGMVQFKEFVDVLSNYTEDGERDIERITEFAREVSGKATFEDDFSLMRIDFS